jgi:protein-S-isoprenylcysteine O-methyltransferase Ste14
LGTVPTETTGRIKAALGSLAFLVLAPGVVAGLMPWLITDWRPLPPGDGAGALRWTGIILIAAGLFVVLDAFARFAWEGLGTPAPVAPTRTLVISGFYRFVRNPMYVAVTALIFGQAILFASWGVAIYGVGIAAAFVTFVRLYEEPTLRRAYGEEYASYSAATPRWIPRLKHGKCALPVKVGTRTGEVSRPPRHPRARTRGGRR